MAVDTFRYSARKLLEVKRWLDENPDGVLNIPVFGMDPMTRDEWHAWFLECLHCKINRGQPRRGRKDNRDWFMMMWRASRELNNPRLVIRWLPAELRGRFGYRVRERGESDG